MWIFCLFYFSFIHEKEMPVSGKLVCVEALYFCITDVLMWLFQTYANTSFSSQVNATSTATTLNSSLPGGQGGFPITSSPGRDSHILPPVEPNVSDLTTSLHVQQFFQRSVTLVSFIFMYMYKIWRRGGGNLYNGKEINEVYNVNHF